MANKVKTCVLLRLSSLGNVAMMVPLLTKLSQSNPDWRFVVVSLKPLDPLFYGLNNVIFYETPAQVEHSTHMLELYHQLKHFKADIAIDLQGDFRTWRLMTHFRWDRVKTYRIPSNKVSQQLLIRKGYTSAQPIETEIERYEAICREAGFRVEGDVPLLKVNPFAEQDVIEHFGTKQGRWIGIAPFAKHLSNVLPFRTSKEVIDYYSRQPNTHIFLFGAGHVETEMLKQWADQWTNVDSVTDILSLDSELELMRKLDVLFCMDSANQHLAALVGTPTVSAWCATHPYMGFAAWGKGSTYILQLPLECRPCTVHGTEKCRLHTFACRQISSEMIINRMDSLLTNTNNLTTNNQN